MKKDYKALCRAITDGVPVYKRLMLWETCTNECGVMAALMAAGKGQKADPQKYRACKKLLKQKVSIFSSIRGIVRPMVITNMTFQADPEQFIDGVVAVYKKLRAIHKLTASSYMVMAAMTIYQNGGLERADENIQRLETIYSSLKASHPFLVSDEDRGYLALLAIYASSPEAVVESIEESYNACKGISISRNAVHSLAQILALSSKSTSAKAEEVRSLLQAMKQAGKKIPKQYGLPAIGALTLADGTVDEKVRLICAIDEELKGKPGFRWYHMGKRTRCMYASIIAFMSQLDDSGLSDTICGTLTMVVVEQIIMAIIIASMAAQTAARSSSSSSGS